MAGEFSPTNSVNNTRAATFIPEIWSDEVIAAYKSNLVMANLVNKMSFKGKKGDTLHIPKPTRGTASAKSTETQVTLQQSTESEVQVLINQHYEYSRFIEDITEVQALASLRKFYTADAGYALAKQVDTDLLKLGRGVKGGDGTIAYDKAVIGSDGSTLYTGTNEAALTDAAIRKVIQTLDDADVPMDGRVLVIPPVAPVAPVAPVSPRGIAKARVKASPSYSTVASSPAASVSTVMSTFSAKFTLPSAAATASA